METNGIIYALKFPNGKLYIGQTWNLKVRHNQKGKRYNTMIVSNAIKKYGWDNIEKIILRDGIDNQQELDNMEIDYVALYSSWHKECGYNRTMGGNGGKLTEDAKRKISISSTGKKKSKEHRNNWN